MLDKPLRTILFCAGLTGCSGIAIQPPAPIAGGVAPSEDQSPGTIVSPRVPVPSGNAELMFRVLSSLGVDYQNGGHSPKSGFDCSGLVTHVYREAFGIRLPHNTQAQSESGAPVGSAELVPGDLVFYNTLNRPYSHVGIYLGDGRFVHAPKTGSQVRVERMQSRYWAERFSGARRIVAGL